MKQPKDLTDQQIADAIVSTCFALTTLLDQALRRGLDVTIIVGNHESTQTGRPQTFHASVVRNLTP